MLGIKHKSKQRIKYKYHKNSVVMWSGKRRGDEEGHRLQVVKHTHADKTEITTGIYDILYTLIIYMFIHSLLYINVK